MEGVSVAGTGVRVGVLVGSGVTVAVLVEVGRLVWVGVGVAVGLGAKALQDAKEMDMTKSSIALPVILIFPRFFCQAFERVVGGYFTAKLDPCPACPRYPNSLYQDSAR